MDTFPAQPQQIPAQPTTSPVSSLAQTPSQQKRDLRKFINLGSWIFLFAFLPITVLIFLSQDSLPGDYFYPVKRGLENVILAAASVNPATRAAFRTDLTETRFKEAQSLVISKANASGLSSFTDDVQAVQLEVANLTNDVERTKAENKLLVKIDQYQNSLTNLQAKTEQNLIAYSVQETPTQIPVNTISSQNQTSPNSVSQTSIPAVSLAPDKIPTPTLTPFSSSASLPKSSPMPSPDKSDLASTSVPTPILTLTPSPTVAPTVHIQQENTQVTQQEKIAQTLRDTKEKLDKIKKDLEEKRGESRNENIQGSGGSNEGETQSQRKNESNKKTETPSRQK